MQGCSLWGRREKLGVGGSKDGRGQGHQIKCLQEARKLSEGDKPHLKGTAAKQAQHLLPGRNAGLQSELYIFLRR